MRNRIRTVSSVAVLAGCALAFGAQQESTRDFNRTLPLRAGQRLRVENKFGAVRVHGSARSDVAIHAVIRVASDDRERAESLLNAIRIEAESTAAGARVATVYPSDTGRSLFSRRNASYSVTYDIDMPQQALADVSNAFGSITVAGVQGGASLSGANGAVRLEDSGGTADIQNRFGAVDVARHKGDVTVRNTNGAVTVNDAAGSANVTNGFGSVRLARIGRVVTVVNKNGDASVEDSGPVNISNSFAQVTARRVKGDLTITSTNGAVIAETVSGAANIRATFGKVTVTHVGQSATVVDQNGEIVLEDAASADLSTTFASVTARQVKGGLKVSSGNGAVRASSIGGAAVVQTSFGEVNLQGIGGEVQVTSSNGAVKVDGAGGAMTVKTSFGSVVLLGAKGPLSVRSQNGSVSAQLIGRGCQPVDIDTSFAPVRVTLPGSSNYDVTASTSFGGIRSDFPLTIQGELNRSAVHGRIGSGGCVLKLTNRNGGVEILKGQ